MVIPLRQLQTVKLFNYHLCQFWTVKEEVFVEKGEIEALLKEKKSMKAKMEKMKKENKMQAAEQKMLITKCETEKKSLEESFNKERKSWAFVRNTWKEKAETKVSTQQVFRGRFGKRSLIG